MELDAELISKAMEATGLPLQATIDEALRALVYRHRKEKVAALGVERDWAGGKTK